MAVVKVEVPGIGEVIAENAATESTLREIAKLLGGSSGSNSQQNSGGGADAGVGGLGKNAKKAGDNIKDMGGHAKTAGERLSEIGHGLGNLLMASIGAVVGGFTNWVAFKKIQCAVTVFCQGRLKF